MGETLSTGEDSLVTELLPDLSILVFLFRNMNLLNSEKLVVLGHSLGSTRSTSLDLTKLSASPLRICKMTYPVLRPIERSAM